MHELGTVENLKSGDEATYRDVVERYNKLVLNCCFKFVRNRESAEDLTQEVFLEVFRSIRTFKGNSQLSTWIYRIAVTKSLNHLASLKRKKRFGAVVSIFEPHEAPDPDTSGLSNPETHTENNERCRVLAWAIGKLPENQKIAFTLSKYDEFSYLEISRIMGTSIPGVESLLHRAKKNLKEILYEYYKNEPDQA
jgi:RNA polymerase sigma-70 factor, ECF subfamily